MQMTRTQKQAIRDQGYVVVPGVVPRVMVDAAVRAINHSVGEGMPADQIRTMRARSYCRELQGDPVITDLFSATPARAMAESVIGAGKLKPVGGGQIALRFPSLGDPTPPRGHLDGMHSPDNGVPEGTISNFTMLVGVLLSDLTEPYAGNFTVWPGTHRIYERFFREHGPDALLNGMPPVETGEPHQITGPAGTVVFCHYQMKHGAAPNVSPHTRYAIFFRLNHVDHNGYRPESMTDIWLEWEGMREVLEEAPAVHA